MRIAVVLWENARTTTAPLALWARTLRARWLLHGCRVSVISAFGLVPTVVVRNQHTPIHAAVPAKFESTLAGHMVALRVSLETSTILASSWTRLPTHLESRLPCVFIVFPVCLLFLLTFDLLLPLLTRDPWMWSVLTSSAESVMTLALEVGKIPLIITPDALFATQVLTVVNMRVVSCEEFEKHVVCFL